MRKEEIIPESQLAGMIFAIVREIDTTGQVNLGDPEFDRLMCSKFRLYRVAKNHCHKYGYEYQPVVYKPSSADYHQPFDKVPDDRKAHFSKPGLIKVKP